LDEFKKWNESVKVQKGKMPLKLLRLFLSLMLFAIDSNQIFFIFMPKERKPMVFCAVLLLVYIEDMGILDLTLNRIKHQSKS